MPTLNNYKQFFSKTNLYFAGSAMFLIIATVFMGFIYSNQSLENTKASLILADADAVVSEITAQEKLINSTVTQITDLMPTNFSDIVNPKLNTNSITKYFDEVETLYSKDGVFSINSINYTATNDQNFVTASFNIDSTEENLLKFLEYAEKTGFSMPESKYLLEVTSFNFSVPLEVEDTFDSETGESTTNNSDPQYSVSLQMRIYNFAN